MNNEKFDKDRFLNLCRQSVGKDVKDYVYLWIKIAVIFAICGFLFNYFAVGFQNSNNMIVFKANIFDSIFKIILYISIIGKALNAFSEYRDKELAISWMMLPGSIMEKFLSRLFISLIGVFVLLYAAYFIGVNIGSILSGNYYYLYFPLAAANRYFNPIGDKVLTLITVINLHAIFFAGGLYFKRHPFIKTCLTVALISLCLTVVLSSFGGLAYAFRSATSGETYYMMNRYWPEFAARAAKLVFYCIVPIFCWVISFYKLKEKQMI